MREVDRDAVVARLRKQILDNDLAIVEAINQRLELVAKLRDYKRSRGYELVDAAREDWLLSHLAGANPGPLSPEGLREIYSALLDLTKRELAIGRETRSTFR